MLLDLLHFTNDSGYYPYHIIISLPTFLCYVLFLIKMERNFNSQMLFNITKKNKTSASASASTSVAAAIAKRDDDYKRKRTVFVRDSGFVPPPLPPYRSAETYLPKLSENASIVLPVMDIDGVGAWPFKYWPNNESRMYVFEGTGPYASKYRLHTGDYMLIYKDTVNGNYVIRAVKASEVEVKVSEIKAGLNKVFTATEGNNRDNVVGLNEVPGADYGAFDLLDEAAYYPDMENVESTSSLTDEINGILKSLGSWNGMDEFCIYPTTPPNISFDDMLGKNHPQVK
ncbi:hypothetical protein QVD17_36149 [Tagetes erecta]|uniref:TF-B3 domain-containing protein n=1 Tax=Tagetes erecta TaxID=13708 RepID=A0AAD8NHV8_TARER|nr:hypothetical protein QVD17_36149 [Tagetes erecta]